MYEKIHVCNNVAAPDCCFRCFEAKQIFEYNPVGFVYNPTASLNTVTFYTIWETTQSCAYCSI